MSAANPILTQLPNKVAFHEALESNPGLLLLNSEQNGVDHVRKSKNMCIY